MMERSLKLPKKKKKKIKPEWRARNFSSRGTADGPAGVKPSSRHPSPLVKGDSCRRKNPRATIGSRNRMRAAEKHPYRSVARRSPPPFPPPSRLLARRSFALAPFPRGRAIAQSRTQDSRRLRHGPHCAAVADGLRRRTFDRPTDRPRSVSRA